MGAPSGGAGFLSSFFLSNLPTLVLGTTSMKANSSGIHHLATRSARNSALVLGGWPSSTHDAGQRALAPALVGHRDHRGLGDRGWAMISFSRSTDEIHSPPDLMTSLARSVIRM